MPTLQKKRMQKAGLLSAKWQKQTEKPEAFAAVTLGICCSVRPPHREALKVRRRSGSEWRAPRAKPSHKEAKSPSSPCARWVNAIPTEKGGARSSSLGHFSNLSGSFPPIAPTRGRPPRCRKKRGRGNRRKIPRAHARTSPSFVFSPSPTCSNSLEHNALGVKISRILTHRKQPATHSESTTCGQSTVKPHERLRLHPDSPSFTPRLGAA